VIVDQTVAALPQAKS